MKFNRILGIIYWIAVIQYITLSIKSTSFIYKYDFPDTDCPYDFLFQLTLWLGIAWAFYFSFDSNNNILLFSLIILQIITFFGRIYELHNKKKVNIDYADFLLHWVGIFIIPFFINKVKFLNFISFLKSFTIIGVYAVVYCIYVHIFKKTKCVPEHFFNVLKLSGFKHGLLILLSYIILSVCYNYLYIKFLKGTKKVYK